MLKSLADNYQLGALQESGRGYELYKGTQSMAGQVTRPVSIRLCKELNPEDPQQMQKLLERIRLLMELEKHPSFKSVHDFGIDAKHGAWIATEEVGTNLAQTLSPAPASPDTVRLVMSQMLAGLMLLHEHEPRIIYRNLWPRNIQLLAGGGWVLNECPLEDGEQATLSGCEIKYIAPEVLDVERGDAVAASDLYSLGMVLYELALGQELFRAQFPAVFPAGGRGKSGADEDQKWLYWHVSPQLTLPPVKDLLPEFPQDLSDNIGRMLHKPLEERASSARSLYQRMAWHEVVKTVDQRKQEEKAPAALTPLAKLLIAIIVLAALAGVGFYGLAGLNQTPRINLVESRYQTDTEFVKVSGLAHDMPPGTRLIVSARRNLLFVRTTAEVDSRSGVFNAEFALPEVGEYIGSCGILDRNDNVLGQAVFTIVRNPPGAVTVHFLTQPLAYGADITVTILKVGGGGEDADARRHAKTDQQGKASMMIPYGEYGLELDHPRFKVLRKILSTGAGRTSAQELELTPLPEDVIQAKREHLQREYQRLQELAAAGDPNAIARMAAIQKELAQLEDPKKAGEMTAQEKEQAQRKQELLRQIEALSSADNNDPEAAAKLAELTKELAKLNGQPDVVDYEDLAKKRAILEEQARNGDPEAVAALKKFDEELRKKGIDPEKLEQLAAAQKEADRRAALGESASAGAGGKQGAQGAQGAAQTATQAAAQKAAQAVMQAAMQQAVQAAMQQAGAAGASRAQMAAAAAQMVQNPQMAVKEIDRQIEALKARAAAGDPEAIKAIAELERKKQILQALSEGKLTPEEAQKLLLGPQPLERITAEQLMGMSLGALRQYVSDLLPPKSFTVTEDDTFDRLVIDGAVLDQQGREFILGRLAPVEKRMIATIRIDPNYLVDSIVAELGQSGIAEPLVHPFLVGPAHRLFVGLEAQAADKQIQAAYAIAGGYITPAQLVLVRRLPPQPPQPARLLQPATEKGGE